MSSTLSVNLPARQNLATWLGNSQTWQFALQGSTAPFDLTNYEVVIWLQIGTVRVRLSSTGTNTGLPQNDTSSVTISDATAGQITFSMTPALTRALVPPQQQQNTSLAATGNSAMVRWEMELRSGGDSSQTSVVYGGIAIGIGINDDQYP